MGAAAWPAPMAWPLCDAPGSHPRAEQRGYKLVGEVGVCAKALQQRAVLLGTIILDAIFRVSRILLDWIHGLLMAAAGNVVVLSSMHQNRCSCEKRRHVASFSNPYKASNYCCTFAANRHPRCFTELARTSILAIGYSMLRTGKRPITELGS
jgi:hypothetical protein